MTHQRLIIAMTVVGVTLIPAASALAARVIEAHEVQDGSGFDFAAAWPILLMAPLAIAMRRNRQWLNDPTRPVNMDELPQDYTYFPEKQA